MIPPVSGGAGDAVGSSSSARRRSTPTILADLANALAMPEDGAVVGFLGRTRSTPGTPAPGQEAEAARHAGGASSRSNTRPSKRWPRRPRTRSPTRSRRASASTGWRSSIGPARCRSARRRSRSSPSRRTGTPPSTRPATRSTRRRRAHPIWKAERFADGHVWIGHQARTGPAEDAMKVYISVDMEGIAGVNHPHPTEMSHPRYPAAVELMIDETNAAIEGALAGGGTEILVNDSHGSMYNLLPSRIHPAARLLQGQKPWSMVEGAGPGRRLRGRAVRRLPRPGRPPARHHRAHLFRRTGRDAPGRPADRRVRPQCARPRRLGRAGRARRGRRCAGRGSRGVAAMGRAGRGQDRGRRSRGRLAPPGHRRGPRSGPAPSARSGGPPPASWSSCGSGRRS